MKINTALCLIGITMFSCIAHANTNTFYGYCIASFPGKEDRQVTNTFFIGEMRYNHNDISDINRSFVSYIREKEGSVDGAACFTEKTEQEIKSVREKAIQQNRDLGRIVETINWTYHGT